MSMMLNTTNQSAAASSAASSPAAPARNAAAHPAGAQGSAAQPAAAQPFAAWLGEQAQAAAQAVQAGLPAQGAGNDADAAAADTAAAAPDGADDEDSLAALPQDGALLGAMAMPLMPLNPAQVAQAVQAAQPSASRPGAQSGAQYGDPGQPSAGTQDRSPAIDGSRRAGAPDAGLALPQAPAMPAGAPARPEQAQAEAVPALRLAVQGQADTGAGANAGGDAGAEAGHGGNAAPAAALAATVPAQPAGAAPASDTVKLAGPPTAWRQSLQEALGERMNVQVGKGIEQAVIRLEPPQLGRIDIAIRHSAGTLEVNITATNGEVLRQLQTVSDNLRSDLSQRQFTEVAVTVAPAQKNSAAPFGDPQQGRGRQQGREQEDQQPGRALAEASNNPSAFSLGGRD
jgi:flagellar hook-length control protein FliK